MSALSSAMDDEALVAWIGDEFPRPIRAVVERIVNEFKPTVGVQQGWWPLLVRLDAQLSAIDPDYRLNRVTAVSGKLVVELEHSAGREPLEAAIAAAARRGCAHLRDLRESRNTTEPCGHRLRGVVRRRHAVNTSWGQT